jgi:ring-1,2-phenylacetyl-CoA epoxidase subunit PaaC
MTFLTASRTSEVTNEQAIIRYLIRRGDDALVLAQRLSELVAGGPELEEELATANFALDYLGQARMFYTRACELEAAGRNEDDLAFLRGEREFENLLLLEQPNGDFGDQIVRQVLFDSFYLLQLEALLGCRDRGLADIAARARKEIQYHLRHASQWLIRLGDGTDESQARVAESLQRIWPYTGEMFNGDQVDELLQQAFDGPDLAKIARQWRSDLESLLARARLQIPAEQWMHSGGRQGRHTEHFGFLLAEMQYVQRAFPGCAW